MLDALAADRARVTALEAQIMDLERSLAALQLERTLVQERLDSYKYPVLTLPNEIVSEIFIHFLPIYPICPPLGGLFSPTTLTQICRKWREIAQTTPALWKAISLSFNGIPCREPAHISDLLSRSGCCPLSIIELHDDEAEDSGSEVLKAALAHRERWQHPCGDPTFPLSKEVCLCYAM